MSQVAQVLSEPPQASLNANVILLTPTLSSEAMSTGSIGTSPAQADAALAESCEKVADVPSGRLTVTTKPSSTSI